MQGQRPVIAPNPRIEQLAVRFLEFSKDQGFDTVETAKALVQAISVLLWQKEIQEYVQRTGGPR